MLYITGVYISIEILKMLSFDPNHVQTEMAPLLHPEETMLQFTYKLKLTERVKAKCSRHPRYNPVKDGRAGIRGGCSTCFSLYDLHQARIALDAAQREFVRRAGPWARQREPRERKAADATEEPPLHP
jgi:hypothetical protein